MKVKTKNKIGYFTAGGVAIGQGFEAVLLQFLFLIFAVAVVKNRAFGTAVMAITETLGLFISLLIFGPSLFIGVIKKMKQKQSWYFIATAILGTSLGNIMYIFAVSQAGASYGVVLTSMYPILSLFLLKFIMKEKENWKVWVGVFITVVSGLLFLLLPTLLNSKEGFGGQRFTGMLLGLLAAFFWALEGILMKKGMSISLDKGQEPFSQKEIVATRSIFTGLSTYAILMPVMMIFGNSFKLYVDIIADYRAILIVGGIAINIVLLRLMHTYSISLIGPKMAATIDTNNFLVPTIFAEFLQFINLHDSQGELLFIPVIWWAYMLIIPIAIGVFMVVYFNENKDPDIHFEKLLE